MSLKIFGLRFFLCAKFFFSLYLIRLFKFAYESTTWMNGKTQVKYVNS